MREAIDYNALSWIRQEVGVTLKQARLQLEEYAEGEQRKELLQGSAAYLHEARGPLQMVNIKGADLLACEMEEAIADLLLETVVEVDTLLEQLMQGFLELPEYLFNLRSGKQDNPKPLFPLINSLRATRGLQPLKEDAIFSPDLSARVPVSVFDVRAQHHEQDVTTTARSARIRFQSGLLEWYRDSSTNHGLQTLVEVLEHLQETARTEPAVRLWWVGAAVAELLRDRVIEAKPAVKSLFGQLDRQIKRLMDFGEKVFADTLTDNLMKNMLFQLVAVNSDSARIAAIRSTYGIAAQVASGTDTDSADAPAIGDELLQTVSATAHDDIERIKEQLDTIMRTSGTGADVLKPVADGLHSLGNTLGMIGMERLGARVADNEQQMRSLIAEDGGIDGADFTDLANTLVTVENALSDITVHVDDSITDEDHGDAVFRQGQQAVINAVRADIDTAKDAINEFLKLSGGFDLLKPVPVLLHNICGGLEVVGEERLAVAARQVKNFVSTELLKNQRELNEDELDSFADAICSIEYCVEELSENHKFGERAIGVAISSLEKLGYSDAGLFANASEDRAVPEPVRNDAPKTVSEAVVESAPEHQPEPAVENEWSHEPPAVPAAAVEVMEISGLQVIAPDADGEIVEIFIEEAGEVLDKLAVDIPAWSEHPDAPEMLSEIRRAFHTIKGSGRMVGAMAVGELARAFEDLLNKVIEQTIPANTAVLELVGQSTSAFKDLVAQVSNPDTILLTDVSALGRRATELCQPEAHTGEAEVSGADAVTETGELVAEIEVPEMTATAEPEGFGVDTPDYETAVVSEPEEPIVTGEAFEADAISAPEALAYASVTDPVAAETEDLPVLKEGADPEIVEIFLEEANEELTSLSLKIPEWILQPDATELLGDIRRSLHTLKGSGRMAGAMIIGEFAWSMEVLLNKLEEGAVQTGGSLFALLSQVPQAVSGLLRQLQDGTALDMDISGMMQKAADLGSGGDGEAPQQNAISLQQEAAEAQAEEDEDNVLMELFSTECHEHLDSLSASVENTGDICLVSDAHYRALHTLTGISESASVHGIGRLAAALYEYFGELYLDSRPPVPEAYVVLDDCVQEMSNQLQRLPERDYDEGVVSELLERIAALPAVVEASGQEPVTLQDGNALAAEALTEDYLADAVETFEEIPELPATMLHAHDEQAAMATDVEDREVSHEAVAGAATETTMAEETAEILVTDAADTGQTQHEGVIYSGMDQELYEIFVEEATEIIDGSETMLRSWSESPDDHDLMADFQRLLHTLKGGARMVDISPIGDLSHALESLLTRVADGAVSADAELFSLLHESHDRLAEMVERVKSRTTIDAANDLESRLGTFMRGSADVITVEMLPEEPAVQVHQEGNAEDTSADMPDQHEAVVDDVPVVDLQSEAEPSGQDDDAGMTVHDMDLQPQTFERRKESRPRGEQVRVQAEVLDSLVNNAGEINIYRARMEQQTSNFRFNLSEMNQTVNRLRDQLRQLEIETETQILFRYEQEADSRNQDFDPLEMDRYSKLQQVSRSMLESISDLRSLQGLMESTTRISETLLLQQSRVSTDLQEGLIRTRMIPFAGLAPRLRRIVRQSARQLDKKVDLHLRGAEGEMDRAVIERIVAPLEHMLRNAVAHGIETPDRRKKAGKSVAGAITIDFNREGSEIVLRIADDGAGLNIDAIRARAIERGLMSAEAELPDADVMQFVLQTGFSTASEVTQIAGRGVGMDVVNSGVKQLGGSLHIDSECGKGTVFTIRLPYTLAINQALLITTGEQIFCVPMGSVEGVVTATPAQLQTCYDNEGQEFGYAGNSYQLMHLGSLLGVSSMDLETPNAQVPVLLIRTGDKRIGMQIDSLLGSREVVIKPLGAQLSLVDGISGATILGDGRVVMILDMFAISRMKAREQAPVRPLRSQENSRLVVMVVDDSITVRKVTSRLLERSGFKVLTAKDGVDAMGQLQENVPDMMLLDIEMPRMDGFELATHMRNDERLKHVPIIMITSRTGDKHRDRAFEIGVNEYLGKPFQESELLTSINNIIGVNTLAVRA